MPSKKNKKLSVKIASKKNNIKIVPSKKNCECYKKIKVLEDKIKVLEDKIESFQQIITDLHAKSITTKRRELKKERLLFDDDEILEFLKYKDHRSIITLLRKQYLKNYNEYPIKCSGKRKYQYWDNNEWIEDLDGHYIINIICYNAQQLFLRVNNIKSPKIDKDIFLENQFFIFKITDYKYQRQILKYIRQEINNHLSNNN